MIVWTIETAITILQAQVVDQRSKFAALATGPSTRVRLARYIIITVFQRSHVSAKNVRLTFLTKSSV